MFYAKNPQGNTQGNTQANTQGSTQRSSSNSWTASHCLQLKTGFNLRSPASNNPSGWGPYGYAGPYSKQEQQEMEACWAVHGESIMEDYALHRPDQRPWYWWVERGLQQPEDEGSALKKMGEI